MDFAALRNELLSDPAGLGYAAKLPGGETGAIAELLNAKTFTAPRSRWISELGVMELYPDGAEAADAMLEKLETFADTRQRFAGVVRRVLRFMRGDGFDIGSPTSQSILFILAQAGVITADEAGKLKSLADKPTSRAEILGFGSVTEQDVIGALNA